MLSTCWGIANFFMRPTEAVEQESVMRFLDFFKIPYSNSDLRVEYKPVILERGPAKGGNDR